MKTFAWALALVLGIPSAYAGSSATLFLRGRVPAKAKLVINPQQGTYAILTNSGAFSLSTHITTAAHSSGAFQVVTVTPQ